MEDLCFRSASNWSKHEPLQILAQPTFLVSEMVSLLLAASLTPPHPPHPGVQCARLSSAPSAGDSGLSGTKEKAIQELCAVR